MRLQVVALADAASVREGLLHVLGLGVTRISVARFPATSRLVLPIMISASLDELPEEHLIVITIEQPDGDTVEFGRIILGPGEVPAETDPAVPLNLLQVIPIGGYAFAAAGVYRVLVQLDDDEPVVLGLSVLGTDGDPTVGEDEITEE